MLEFNPYYRPTARQLLKNKIFDGIRIPSIEERSPQKIVIDIDKNEFNFGVSLDDIKYINAAKINGYSTQKSMILKQNTNMLLNIDNEIITIDNHFCVYKVFYFYFIILLLPLVTIFSKGPNTVHILSSYIVSSVATIGIIFLFLTLVL